MQFSGGAAPTEVINDGLFVWHLPTGQWSLYGGIYAASLATVWKDPNTTEVWVGDYWGRAWRFTEDTTEGQVVTDVAVSYSGTATGGTTFTLTDSAATFLTSPGDQRLLGMFVWITGGTGVGQVRKVIGSSNSTKRLHVNPAWTSPPSTDSTWVMGHYYAAAEFGDWDFGEPDRDKDLETLLVFLENLADTTNTLDAAVAALDVGDTTAAFEFGGAGADSTKKPITISLPPVSGVTQRLRVAMKLADVRPRIRAMTVIGTMRGHAYG